MVGADIDECAEGSFICPGDLACVNTEGSYQCNCSAGDCRGTLSALLATISMLPHVLSL